MTRNVLEYLGVRETVRSNQAKEEETKRSNLAKEAETRRYNEASLAEQARHNAVTEAQNALALSETRRSNRANEAIGATNAQSQQRTSYANAANSAWRGEELDWKRQYDSDVLAQTIWRDKQADIRAGDANSINLTNAQTNQFKLQNEIDTSMISAGGRVAAQAVGKLLSWILK